MCLYPVLTALTHITTLINPVRHLFWLSFGCCTVQTSRFSYKPTQTAGVAGRFMLHLQNTPAPRWIYWLSRCWFSIWMLDFNPASHICSSPDHSCVMFKLMGKHQAYERLPPPAWCHSHSENMVWWSWWGFLFVGNTLWCSWRENWQSHTLYERLQLICVENAVTYQDWTVFFQQQTLDYASHTLLKKEKKTPLY